MYIIQGQRGDLFKRFASFVGSWEFVYGTGQWKTLSSVFWIFGELLINEAVFFQSRFIYIGNFARSALK